MIGAAAPTFYGYAVVLVAIGALTVTFMTLCNTMIQMSAATHVRGRVMGLFNLVFIGGGAAGGPLIGALDEHAGPRIGLLVSGAIPAVITVVVAWRVAWRSGMKVSGSFKGGSEGVLPVTPFESPTISPTAQAAGAGPCDCGCQPQESRG